MWFELGTFMVLVTSSNLDKASTIEWNQPSLYTTKKSHSIKRSNNLLSFYKPMVFWSNIGVPCGPHKIQICCLTSSVWIYARHKP